LRVHGPGRETKREYVGEEGDRERVEAKYECRCRRKKRPERLIALRDAINSAADGTGPDRSTSFAAAW
jgi:hypothetical protein